MSDHIERFIKPFSGFHDLLIDVDNINLKEFLTPEISFSYPSILYSFNLSIPIASKYIISHQNTCSLGRICVLTSSKFTVQKQRQAKLNVGLFFFKWLELNKRGARLLSMLNHGYVVDSKTLKPNLQKTHNHFLNMMYENKVHERIIPVVGGFTNPELEEVQEAFIFFRLGANRDSKGNLMNENFRWERYYGRREFKSRTS
jgi:hypothetical protein